MWLLLYREWKWVLLGLHFVGGVGYTSHACSLQLPNFSPEQWVRCAVPTAYFSSGYGCNRGGCVGYTSGAVINHLLKRGMVGAGIVRRIPAPRCVMGC